ncbi:MAG TPA: hypothetical protein VM509_07925, partial [Planctomycetota bacterium]|nr:hypothetical protein [Planctomycetota bacterium]
MRGGWLAVCFALVVVGGISAWESWRKSHEEAARDRSRIVACNRALRDTAERHEAHAKELDEFGGEEKGRRDALEAERASAVRAIEAISLRGSGQDLLAPLKSRLDGKPGIERIEVTRRADEQRTAGWQEYAIRLRGGWEEVTTGIDAVHDLPIVVRVERLEIRLDRTRRRATLDARVIAAVWSDPRVVERTHPELANPPSDALVPSACHPLDLCRNLLPEPEPLERWQRACKLIDERSPIAQSYRLIESEEEEVRRLQQLVNEVAAVRATSRASVGTRGPEMLERAEKS